VVSFAFGGADAKKSFKRVRFRHPGVLLFLVILLGTAGWADETNTLRSTGKTQFSNAGERYQEVDYWDEIHRKEKEKHLEEKKQREEKRIEIRSSLSNLVEAGASALPPPPEIEPQVLPPPPPSFVEKYRTYLFLAGAVALMGALTAYTLFRHRREREIRILTGKYLSDGTEAAWIQMPHLFAGPGAAAHLGLDLAKQDEEKDAGDEDAKVAEPSGPVVEFFKQVPELLAGIRKLLPDLNRAMDDAERKKALLKLHEQIVVLKTKANCWDLRPVWQLTSALELLLKRLADKCKELTPSTSRTVATAIDLLAEICVPGVRPDLIISPPIAVLAVDDDPLCLRAVMFALQKAEMTPDTAENGEGAVLLATDKSYDVIFLDIKMPGIDGLRACEQIHALKKNENTPVVFVTALNDFRTRAESTLAGGSDLMIKPFLMFEITVKVLIFTMRKRLGLAASLKREVASLTGASQLDGKAIAVQPVPHPAIPVPLDEIKAPVAKEGPVLPELPVDTELPVNGANGSHHATVAEELSEPKKVYAGAELPSLRMAPAAPLARETRVVQEIPAAEKADGKTKKWLKRQKELAKFE
jgi:CheY-like chemotaxis protein